MRILYPGIVVGAVASSGPVLAELNFYQYLEVVKASLAVTKQGCEFFLSFLVETWQFSVT